MKYDGAIRFDLARVIPADVAVHSGAQTARVIMRYSTTTPEVWAAEQMEQARGPTIQAAPSAQPLKKTDLNTPADGWAGILATQVGL